MFQIQPNLKNQKNPPVKGIYRIYHQLFQDRKCSTKCSGKKLSNMNSKGRHEINFPNALCIEMPFECELCPSGINSN